jgi:glycosyltransferase involved in cell wall biosynthesis
MPKIFKKISVIILTKDEERNIFFCLDSLRAIKCNIYIIDSHSTDNTVAIAQSFGARVFENAFINQSSQLRWALRNVPIETEWCLRLDADEYLTPELAREINNALISVEDGVNGFIMKRRFHFLGRWIKHGGYYPTRLLRLWRHGYADCEDKHMNEHMLLRQGLCRDLQNDFIDENHNGLGAWTHKHNLYSDRELNDLGDQNNYKASVKLYRKAPLFLRAFLYWLYRYFFKLGFLDGFPGLVFHFLQGFWYPFLIDAKIYELKQNEFKASEN